MRRSSSHWAGIRCQVCLDLVDRGGSGGRVPEIEEAGSHLRGPGQIAGLERLDTEHDTLRAALERNTEVVSLRRPVPTRFPASTSKYLPFIVIDLLASILDGLT